MLDALLPIGTTVKMIAPHARAGETGKIINVDPQNPGTLPYFIRLEGDGGGTWYPANVVEKYGPPQPEDPAITELKEKADRFEKLWRDAQERLAEQQRRYRHDMGVIQDVMKKVKEAQSWCDDGWNDTVEEINDQLHGGWEFEKFRSLVERTVRVRGEVLTSVTVWVEDGDDEEDTDNWKDEDGDDVDSDEVIEEAVNEERSRNGWDTLEVI